MRLEEVRIARSAIRSRFRTQWCRAFGGQSARDRGQALVELVLVSVVLLVLVAAAIDLGRLYFANITIENAARTGSLQAARSPASFLANADCTTTNYNNGTNLIHCAVQRETIGSIITIPAADIAVACETTAGVAVACPSQPQPGIRSRVSLEATFQPLMPILHALLGGSTLQLSSAAVTDQVALPASALPGAPPTAGPTAAPTAPPPGGCPVPVAQFTGAPISGNSPLTVTFDSSASTGSLACPITTWSWTFGQGAGSTQANPTKVYTNTTGPPGNTKTFTVSLTVTSAGGSNTLTRTNYISVRRP